MAKKLSDQQKEELVKFFSLGKSIDQLSKEFNFTKLTIARNLKKILGEKKYEELFNKSKLAKKNIDSEEKASKFRYAENSKKTNQYEENPDKYFFGENSKEIWQSQNNFTEIVPLEYDIDHDRQKDLSSIPISDVKFPKIVYMIVNNKIELETKFLKDYPDWQFLSEEELSRKTIQIYNDLKIAKRDCNREQKVIKVPNTEVFKIVSSILISRGITRIVNADTLIAL